MKKKFYVVTLWRMVSDSLPTKLHIIFDSAKIIHRFLAFIMNAENTCDCNLADIVCQIAIIECTKLDISPWKLCTMNYELTMPLSSALRYTSCP